MQLSVDHIQQSTPWSCALACLEMVARYHGCADFKQREIYDRVKVKIPGQENQWGVSNHSVLVEAQRLGLLGAPTQLNYRNAADMMGDIEKYVGKMKCPLIATQRVHAEELFLGHSRVIVGYDATVAGGSPDTVIFHDPAYGANGIPAGGASIRMSAIEFAKMWRPNGCVGGGDALLITKKA